MPTLHPYPFWFRQTIREYIKVGSVHILLQSWSLASVWLGQTLTNSPGSCTLCGGGQRERECACVCVCVCVWECECETDERERGRERERKKIAFYRLEWVSFNLKNCGTSRSTSCTVRILFCHWVKLCF